LIASRRSQVDPGRRRDSLRALVAEEADVGAGFALAQGRGEVGDPGRSYGLVLGSLVERGEVGHDPSVAVREGGGWGGDAGHRPAEHPQLRGAHRRVGGLQVLDDRLGHLPVGGMEQEPILMSDRARFAGCWSA
jgi:hypothetical protein